MSGDELLRELDGVPFVTLDVRGDDGTIRGQGTGTVSANARNDDVTVDIVVRHDPDGILLVGRDRDGEPCAHRLRFTREGLADFVLGLDPLILAIADSVDPGRQHRL